MKRTSSGALVALLTLWTSSLSPVPVLAHQYWLAPSSYSSAPGRAIDLGAAVGTGFRGPRTRWNPARAVRFVARTSSLVDLEEGAAPEAVWARFTPSDSEGAMIAFESAFAPIELPGAEFDAYLHEEGLDETRRLRQEGRYAIPARPVREMYRRCAKTWIGGNNASRATSPFGLPLEIVPQSAPGGDSRLSVSVLANGKPAAGLLVKAWRSPLDASGLLRDPEARDSTGVVWSGRTDDHGMVLIPAAEPGEWLLSVVRMEPFRDPELADWESTWASLTFERR